MESIFGPFIESFNAKCHLHNLVRHKPLFVCLDTEQGVYYLSIESEMAYVPLYDETTNEGAALITISTSYQTAQELLGGMIKLRDAQARQKLTITGTLRSILLLETILYLARTDVQCA